MHASRRAGSPTAVGVADGSAATAGLTAITDLPANVGATETATPETLSRVPPSPTRNLGSLSGRTSDIGVVGTASLFAGE